MRRKVLSSLIMLILVLFSIVTLNTFRKLDTEEYAKYGKYEYMVSSIKDKRKIEIELGSHYMMSEET